MIERSMFFDGWEGIARVTLMAAVGYTALLVMLRVSRKRTLAQMNAYDFLYIVIVGELMAITILDHEVSLAEGLAAVAVLIVIQVFISWITTRSRAAERIINGEPTLLMRRGRFLPDAMKEQRVTEEDILSAVREEGVADLDAVEAVVLETNGAFSVVHIGTPSSASSLRDVPENETRP